MKEGGTKISCPFCRLTNWLRTPSLKTIGTLVLVIVILNLTLLLLVLPVAAGAASSWNPTLLVNTEAFQVIDDVDTGANVELKFGQTLQERLRYNRSQQRFEFTNSLFVGGSITATGSLSVKGTMSGSSLRVDRNADIWGNLAVSGTTVLDGNVGIGTATPDVSLSVAGTASGRILSFGNRLTGSGHVSIRTLTDSTTAMQVLDQDGGEPVLNVDTENERVGIGTASPSYALHVNGSIYGSNSIYGSGLYGMSSVQGSVFRSYAGNANLKLRLQDNAYRFAFEDKDTNEVVSILSTGAIGVGTTVPETKLEVLGTMSGASLAVSNLLNCNTIDTDAAGNLVCGTDEGGAGGLSGVDAEGMFVNQGGDTMTGALSIRPITAGEAALEVAGTASGRILSFGNRLTGSGTVSIRTLTDSTTAMQVLDQDGGNPVLNVDTTNERVGIGTAAPADALDVSGAIRLNTDGSTTYKFLTSGMGRTLEFQNLATAPEKLSFTTSLSIFGDVTSDTFLSVTPASGWSIFEGVGGQGTVLSNSGDNPIVLAPYRTEMLRVDSTHGMSVKGAMSGASLAVSNLLNCDTINTDANGNLVCGTDSGGISQTDADAHFVNQGGDTMTGALSIRPITAGEAALEVAGTASGRILSFGNRLTGSGHVSIRTLSDSVTGFQIFKSTGTRPIFNVDTSNERVGIGTAAPETQLEVVGTLSGSQIRMGNATVSGSIVYTSGSTLMAGAKGSSGQILLSQGTAAPAWLNPTSALVWYVDGAQTTGTSKGATVVLPFGFTCTDVDMRIDTAPAGSSLIVDINKDGATLFSTNPEIDAAGTTEDGNHVFGTTILPAGSVITLDIDQVGSSTAGTDLTVILKGTRKY